MMDWRVRGNLKKLLFLSNSDKNESSCNGTKLCKGQQNREPAMNDRNAKAYAKLK